jgi:hypothetical protein
MTKQVYISGPMTGYEDLNFPAFHKAAKLIRDRGDIAVNPAEINPDLNADWLECIIEDIKWVGKCDSICLLNNWEFSTGAQIEFLVAEKLGLKIEYENDLE